MVPTTKPVPVKVVIWGLALSLSVIDKLPVRGPLVVGANVTLIAQLVPTPRLVPQLLVCA